MWSKKSLAILLAVVAILLYSNTLYNGYVLDDVAVIKDNAYVIRGIAAIPTLLTTPYLKGYKRAADTAASNDLYRPASLVMFAAEYQLSEGSPTLSHFMNMLVFAGCVVLLFLFLYALFDRADLAFVAALLFAVHPIHTEVVANIKSRDELLCFFFAFASLLSFTGYARLGTRKKLVYGTLFYFLSLLSKETSACFIAIIPLVFFFYINDNRKRSVQICISPFITLIIYIIIRYSVLIHYNAWHGSIIDLTENELIGAPSVAAKLATAIYVLGYYIRLLFIPYPLSSDYSFRSIPFTGFDNLWVWITLFVYIGLIIIGIARLIKKTRDPYAFGILFYLISIVLFSNILFLVGAVMAERFLFFASAGFCTAVAVALCSFFPAKHGNALMPKQRGLIAGIILIIFSVITFQRNLDWKDNYTLFKADVEKYPENARLWYSLGYVSSTVIFEDAQDMNTKAKVLSESIADMQKAVAIYPNYSMAHNDLGKLFQKIQQYDSAEIHLKKSVALNSKDPVNKTDLGGLYFTKGDYSSAAYYCAQALQIEPRNVEIINNLALCYLMMKKYDSALLYAQKARQIAPDNALAAETITSAQKAIDASRKP